MKAWHFLPDDRRMRYGARELVEVGRTYTADGPLVLCENGMHASKRLIDALQYAPGAVICRVELTGGLQHQDDKSVGRSRMVLWMIDGTSVLHEFACMVAEEALTLAKVKDKRSWAAIDAKRKWLRGEITDQELAAARNAAWNAAWDAARDAAENSAENSAGDAAWNAAWDAAMNAAWNAARNAAWDAAMNAAWAKWNRMLTGMVVAAHRKQEDGQ